MSEPEDTTEIDKGLVNEPEDSSNSSSETTEDEEDASEILLQSLSVELEEEASPVAEITNETVDETNGVGVSEETESASEDGRSTNTDNGSDDSHESETADKQDIKKTTESISSEKEATDSISSEQDVVDSVSSEKDVTDSVSSEKDVADSVSSEKDVTDSVSSVKDPEDSGLKETMAIRGMPEDVQDDDAMDFDASAYLQQTSTEDTSLKVDAKSYLEDFILQAPSNSGMYDSDSVPNEDLGVALKKFPAIVKAVKSADYAVLQILYRLLYLRNAWDIDKMLVQRIMDFSGFDCDRNSEDFYSREVMLRTMPFTTCHKIGVLLNIQKLIFNEDIEKLKEELISKIMNFLYSPKKLPSSRRIRKPRSKKSPNKNKKAKTKSATLVVTESTDVIPITYCSTDENIVILSEEDEPKSTFTEEKPEIKMLEENLKKEIRECTAKEPIIKVVKLSPKDLAKHSIKSEAGVINSETKPVKMEVKAIPQKTKKLGDFPGVFSSIEGAPDQLLVEIHNLLFLRKGSSDEQKNNILDFSGFIFPEKCDQYTKRLAFLNCLSEDIVKSIARALYLDEKTEKYSTIQHIMAFLKEPDEKFLKQIANIETLLDCEDFEEDFAELSGLESDDSITCEVYEKKFECIDLISSGEDSDGESESKSPETAKSQPVKDDIKKEVPKVTPKKVPMVTPLKKGQPPVAVLMKKPQADPYQLKSYQTSRTHVTMKNSTSSAPPPAANSLIKEHLMAPVPKPTASVFEATTSSNKRSLRNFETITKIINTHPTEYLVDIYNLLFMNNCELSTIRKDILDFSGFEFLMASEQYVKRKQYLDRMMYNSVRRIYNTLIHNTKEVKIFSKPIMINEIFKFLFKLPDTDTSVNPYIPKPSLAVAPPYNITSLQKDVADELTLTLQNLPDTVNSAASSQSGRLSDLKRVFQRVACFPCEYLVDVHKLLFMTDCEMKNIRANIFGFKGFSFSVYSPEFNQRKMFLDYLTFHSLRKISSVLTTKAVDMRNSTKHELATHLTDVLKEYTDTVFETAPMEESGNSNDLVPLLDAPVEQIVVTPIIQPLDTSPCASPEPPASDSNDDDNMEVSSSSSLLTSIHPAYFDDDGKQSVAQPTTGTSVTSSSDNMQFDDINLPEVAFYQQKLNPQVSTSTTPRVTKMINTNVTSTRPRILSVTGTRPTSHNVTKRNAKRAAAAPNLNPLPVQIQNVLSQAPNVTITQTSQLPTMEMQPELLWHQLAAPYVIPQPFIHPLSQPYLQQPINMPSLMLQQPIQIPGNITVSPITPPPLKRMKSDNSSGGVERLMILDAKSLANKQDDSVNSSSSIIHEKIRDAITKGSEDDDYCDTPLSKLVGHPNDKALKQQICDIVEKTDLQDITINGVIQKIFSLYPKFDLNYRKDFIKSTLRSLLYQLGEQTNSEVPSASSPADSVDSGKQSSR